MRELFPGSRLDQLCQSDRRYPRHRVLLHNPRCTTRSQVATNTFTVPPFDISAYVSSVGYQENCGFEDGENPSSTRISLKMQRHPHTGVAIRRGLLEDGVIVQVFLGDARVAQDEWICIFTGVFRGRPGDDPGTPADKSEGFTATAYGREEGFLNLTIEATNPYPADTDLGVMAVDVAANAMGLTMEEILFGDLGYETRHLTNQLVDINALTALYNLGFPVGKKPKFDSYGRLRFIDVNLDKPAVRIYRDGALIRSLKATPNEIEVNNSVVVKGLDSKLTKAKSEVQLIDTFEAITGFFDASFKQDKYFSQDHSQRAEDTYLVTEHRISWSDADWTQEDEFHGRVDIDCRTLYGARLIIFATYLSLQIAVAALDLLMQTIPDAGDFIVVSPAGEPVTVAVLRSILYVMSVAALAGLLWSMQFIGRGSYQIWGSPYEFVYQELMVRMKLMGLEKVELREIEFRNDFVDNTDDLQLLAYDHLRREMLKNQTHEIVMMDDPLLEVDDIIEIAGERHYILTVARTLEVGKEPTMTLKTWLIWKDVFANATATVDLYAAEPPPGYGGGYSLLYGKEL